MRHPLVMGNWKLNGSRHMVHELVSNLRKELAGVAGCAVAIAPPEMYIDMAKREAEGSHIMLGAQNVDLNLSGAFTGETSAAMLKDIGAQYIIIGHSERRTYHKESDELIAKKFAVLKEQGLTPVLCIGETEAENEAGKTEEVCARQIDAVLKTQGAAAFEGAVIAYEPVWAIGTGKSATPAQAQAVHKFIRDHIAKVDANIAEQVIIQYGGSVNASNAAELFAQPDIDGALVGNVFCDGVIAATPTGSTAYSLSAGGPILAGGLDAIAVTTVCPHTLYIRPIVTAADTQIRFSVAGSGVVPIDGARICEVQSGDAICVTGAERRCLFIRFGHNDLYSLIRKKLS